MLYAAHHFAQDVAEVRSLDVQEDLMCVEEQHPRSAQADRGQLLKEVKLESMSHDVTLISY